MPRFVDDENNAVLIILDSVPPGIRNFAKIVDNEIIEFSPN
jgi:hypothetical protein